MTSKLTPHQLLWFLMVSPRPPYVDKDGNCKYWLVSELLAYIVASGDNYEITKTYFVKCKPETMYKAIKTSERY